MSRALLKLYQKYKFNSIHDENFKLFYCLMTSQTAAYTMITYSNHFTTRDPDKLAQKTFSHMFIGLCAGAVWPIFWPMEIGKKVVYALNKDDNQEKLNYKHHRY